MADGDASKEEHCAFCDIVNREGEAYIVYESEHVLAFLGAIEPEFAQLTLSSNVHYM